MSAPDDPIDAEHGSGPADHSRGGAQTVKAVNMAQGAAKRNSLPISRFLILAVSLLACLGVGVAQHDPVIGAGPWAGTGSLNVARSHAVAVRLPDGRVLVAGGQNGGAPLASAEIYNPATGTWSVAASMLTPRTNFAGALMGNGRVLVAGGTNASGYLASAEIYDPTRNTWSPAMTMNQARSSLTATALNDGRVLVVGGFGLNGTPLGTAEIYDPGANSWTYTDPMRVARGNHVATLLADGTVLITGGFGGSGPISSVEIYDPANRRWAGALPLPTLVVARYGHTATLLPNGMVLVAGGMGAAGPLDSAELFDPVSRLWEPAASMTSAREFATATLLPSGQVLVAGGEGNTSLGLQPLSSAEIYDPVFDRWTSAGSMAVARYGHTATLLNNGQVLVAGGAGQGDSAGSELFSVVYPVTASVTAVTATNTPTLLPTFTPVPPTATPSPTMTPTMTATLTPTPAPLSFYIRGARVEHAHTRPDWRLSRPPVTRSPVGKKIRLSIYISLTSVSGHAHLYVASDIRLNGKVMRRNGLTEDVSEPGNVWVHWNFTPHTAGRYVFTGAVTLNNKTRHVAAYFDAVGGAQTISFTFDRLQTLNRTGRPATSFARSERVFVVATITVHGVQGTVPVIVGQQLEYRKNGKWIALGKRVQNAFVTTNGTHPYSVSFFPQSPYSPLRMVIDITIGKVTKSRFVQFTVHG